MVRIILVRPQLGENIGATARVMANFGLEDLWILSPRDGWPNASAEAMAASAGWILDRARVISDWLEALEGVDDVYGLTARERSFTQPVWSLEGAVERVGLNQGRTALVFGPERSGLHNEDLAYLTGVITLPTDPRCPSLNLAQAVAVCAYAFRQTADRVGRVLAPGLESETKEVLADRAMVMRGADAWIGRLEAAGYFFPEHKAEAMKRMVRHAMGRHRWTIQEVRTWLGMMGALAHPRRCETDISEGGIKID